MTSGEVRVSLAYDPSAPRERGWAMRRRVGSFLYGVAGRDSDVDLLVIASEGDRQPCSVFGHTGPACTQDSNGWDVRYAHPELFVSSLLAGHRWAWEFCLGPPEGVIFYSLLSNLVDCVREYALPAIRSCAALDDYVNRRLPDAQARHPLPYPDHAAWFKCAGWHYKVGYYLLLECVFRTYVVFDGRWLRLQVPRGLRDTLCDARCGRLSLDAWRDAFRDCYTQASRACAKNTSAAVELDPTAAERLLENLSHC